MALQDMHLRLDMPMRCLSSDVCTCFQVFIEGGFDPVLELLDNPKAIVDAGGYAVSHQL
jgi:hypothetical protein